MAYRVTKHGRALMLKLYASPVAMKFWRYEAVTARALSKARFLTYDPGSNSYRLTAAAREWLERNHMEACADALSEAMKSDPVKADPAASVAQWWDPPPGAVEWLRAVIAHELDLEQKRREVMRERIGRYVPWRRDARCAVALAALCAADAVPGVGSTLNDGGQKLYARLQEFEAEEELGV